MREYNSYRGKSGAKKWLAALLVLIIAGILAFAALEFVILRGAKGQDAQAGDGPEVMVVLGTRTGRPSSCGSGWMPLWAIGRSTRA